ncbi:LOW QUALITY PROTEIN: uncharacterized protein ACIGJ3_017818 [Trichechus inunguis]
MARQNDSAVTEFVLQGLTDKPELQLPLFLLFLGIYGVTVVGNVGMLFLITFSSNLHAPMYFFLSNLSAIDLFYSSVITPKLMENFVWEQSVISYPGCMTQLFFFCFFATAECYMLTAMAYDRYVAICSPLLYNVTMSPKVCSMLVTGVYIMASIEAVPYTISMIMLFFCEDNVIHHYFCDILPLLKLSCSITYINELLVVLVGGFNALATIMAIIISYAFILCNILQIPSAEGKSKAFSTCGSHLTAVGFFYGSIIFMYFKPSSSSNMAQEKVASVFYTTVIPMLNPLIYSWRNKEVRNVLRKAIGMSRLLYNVMLVTGIYIITTFGSMAYTISTIRLFFSSDNVIYLYFCDIPPLLKLSCSSTYINALLLILPATSNNMAQENVASVLYTTVIPVLNPLIYCLRNKDVKDVLSRVMGKMAAGNHSKVTEFILAGLTETPELQLPLFLFFLGVHVVTVLGNRSMITLIRLSSHVHTPMYYFLSSLSFIDLCYSTVITPKMLVSFVTQKNIISYPKCMTQLYFFAFLIISECHMLAVMAYDHYVVICKPLLYNVTVSYHVCSWMVVEVYMMGLIGATAHTGCMLRVVFCKDKIVNHYFCDLFPLLELSCSSTYINEVVLLCFSIVNFLAPTLTILFSYVSIIASILRIRSRGRSKAFSTCSSHILAVTFFYGSAASVYLQPSNVSTMDQGKVSSVFYTVIVPMLNPLIYSLRNKDVKVALNKIIEKRLSCINEDF